MKLFQPPICKSRQKEDQEKFNLTWYIGVVLLVFLTLLIVLNLDYAIDNVIVSVGGVLLALLSLSILFFTGKYFLVGILVVVLGSLLFQYSIYSLANPDRIIDTLWIIIFALYGYFMLNNYWGTSVLVVNLIGLMLHQYILGPSYEFHKPVSSLGFDIQLDYYVNFSFAIIALSFLMIKILNKGKD